MAGVVLVAVVLTVAAVAGSIGWAARDQQARDKALDIQVAQALDEAQALLEDSKWPQALPALDRADKLLAAAGRDDLPPGVLELRQDVAMARRLEEIYSQPTEENLITQTGPSAEYAQAFRDYGIDVAVLPVAEAVLRIQQRSIRLQLARALDSWSLSRRRLGSRRQPEWKHLLEVAKMSDPDPYRDQLRDALERDDHKALEGLAAPPKVADLPPLTLDLSPGNRILHFAGLDYSAGTTSPLLPRANRA
jgi:hypothetical protein